MNSDEAFFNVGTREEEKNPDYFGGKENSRTTTSNLKVVGCNQLIFPILGSIHNKTKQNFIFYKSSNFGCCKLLYISQEKFSGKFS